MTALPPRLRALPGSVHDAMPACAACPTRGTCLFTGLGEGPLADGARSSVTSRALRLAEQVEREGQPGLRVHVVRQGTIKLQHQHPNGHVRIVRLLGPGHVFGLEALLHEPYSHDAAAVGQVTVCSAPSGALLTWADHDPQAYANLMRHWKANVDQADFVIDSLSTGTARERVWRLLHHLARHQPGGAFVAPSRADMGALLGLTTETASRTMAAFAREGVLTERRGLMYLTAGRGHADAA
ncbi:Crp/Fnr family transcriptional regulator [uncultured Aquabacterium sp.]|uniref:Crp/Fnr family transcriptional regulator n=1 Tax=uncultured Aquabacterium sp. TaxID=158753 RepID=UPI00261E1060|nr:Crp/Fnr family transcriptional regulator [uncultured Aquabacterium sp.]